MSCFVTYKGKYNTLDQNKSLGTLADDVTGDGCILPRHLIKMFNTKVPGTEELISVTNCALKNANTREAIQLETDENGCRVNFSNMDQSQAAKVLTSLQTIYDKNVKDRIAELTVERDKRRAAYSNTVNEFTQLDNQVKKIIQDYNTNISESNVLQTRKRELQSQQRSEFNLLNQVREQIQSETQVASSEIGNLESSVLSADEFLKFVCITQHCDYNGIKNTFTPGLYSPLPNVEGLSAIVIPPGMQITLWTDLNYSGETITLTHKDFDKKTCLVNAKYNHTLTSFMDMSVPQPPVRGRIIPPILKKIPFSAVHKKSFNDNVKSVEVQKVDSILNYIDAWNGTI